MIIDAKLDFKNRKLLLIKLDGTIDEIDAAPPYFYLITKAKESAIKNLLSGEDAWLEPDNKTPIVYKGERYEPDPSYKVYRVYVEDPRRIPKISEALRNLGARIAASNVRYVIRLCFDNFVRFFNIIPLYYGFDKEAIKKIQNIEGLVIDVEAVEGKPILASVYRYRPFEEVRPDDVESLWLPEEADRLQYLLMKYPLILGHNIVGFDIPVLKRAGFVIDTRIKLLFDTSRVLATYGASLKVGSARSLLDVATILKDDAHISDQEIEIKRKVRGRIDKLSKEELVKYNANDVVLTAKILNIIFPFTAIVSGLSGIPPSEIMELPSGMVAEYYFLRFCELLGFVPEYRPTGIELEGERVWLEGGRTEYQRVLQTDVKMMYPSFVSRNYIDPTLRLPNGRFDRKSGLGILYSAVQRLITLRSYSKKLKNEDPLYEPVDAGIKAILNALAYGAQAKKSSLAILGNPWCPSTIFYGTREAQFKTIEFLRKKGIRVIYSDTDSFFIALPDCEGDKCEEIAKEIVKTINEFLRQYGLEVDVEDIWDKMFIYSKKNYILKKGQIVILKGSALINLERMYTPECVSLREILATEDKQERLRLLKDMIESAPIEDLFVRGHQQIWRLIGKDTQSLKRQSHKKERYAKALTPWNEKPYVYLKKAGGGQMLLPHSNPIFALFLDGSETVNLEDLNPFNIVELRALKVDGHIARLKGRYTLGDLIIWNEGIYTLWFDGLYYVIETRGKIWKLPSRYEGKFGDRPIGTLRALEGKIGIKQIKIDEDLLRRLVLEETKATLRRYGFL